MSSVFNRAFAACAIAGAFTLFASAPAHADDDADVNKLIKAGQYDQAMQKVDAALVQRPRDAQMRFLKGLIYTEQGKVNDAIGVFIRLTEDYPELPEPYNNLAVLYASQGQYEKARAALEMAIRTHPSYATAHENLGDVYAKLASQAYDKAFQLDSTNTAAQTKLALIRDLFSNSTAPKKASAVPTASAKPPVIVASASTKPALAPAPVPTFTPAPAAAPAATSPAATKPTVVAAASTPVAPPVSAPAPASPPVTAPSATASTPKPAPVKTATPQTGDQADVSAAVNAWAQEWSEKNIDAYLAAYAVDFSPAPGQTRKQWEDERRARILGKSSISVKVDQIEVTVNGDHATARFRQDYHADHLVANSRKTLTLIKTGNRWLIQQERTGA